MQDVSRFRVLQVNLWDNLGGAAQVAWNLHRAYQQRGIDAWMAVDQKFSQDPRVLTIQNERYKPFVKRSLLKASRRLRASQDRVPSAYTLSRILAWLAEPIRRWNPLGREDFDYPGSRHLLDLLPAVPHIVHCHNLHGGYFDLSFLPYLSRQVPVVLTLHDAWLLSGHCAHSLGCNRWQSGCGHCPDLSIYPPIRRDTTAYNWQRKRQIYARSRLYLATPCQWLMRMVDQSILRAAIQGAQIIPHGVDLSVFRPSDRRSAREKLGIPYDSKVVLLTADSLRQGTWKNCQMMLSTIRQVPKVLQGTAVRFVALGDFPPQKRRELPEVNFISYRSNRLDVACCLQAADIYVHPARADTYPNSIIESLACGIPVVATAIGGIPEQVNHLRLNGELGGHDISEATGILVRPDDGNDMARAVIRLLEDGDLSGHLAANAVRDAQRRFDLNDQVETYLQWYRAIVMEEC